MRLEVCSLSKGHTASWATLEALNPKPSWLERIGSRRWDCLRFEPEQCQSPATATPNVKNAPPPNQPLAYIGFKV